MHTYYKDLYDRIAEPPLWFDEAGVPRWTPFAPNLTWNVYAREAVLMEIECQACARTFAVCMTWSREAPLTLAEAIRQKRIHYGDPPNVGCCATGPTMNSVPKRVLEYWTGGERRPELEIDVMPDWARDS